MTIESQHSASDTDGRAGGLSRRSALGVLGLGALGMVASSPAGAAPDERRITVTRGKISGRLTSETTTEGRLRGAGPLNGTTALAIETFVPSAGLPPEVVPPTTLSYTGLFTIATKRGTVTLRDVGVFDADLSTDGEFTSRGRVVGGTGRWEGATGVLFFWGDTTPDGTFTAEANGTVCVPRG